MILDATCGLKQMWFQKDAKDVVYLDRRHNKIEYNGEFKGTINPNIIADNRFLPFKNECFDMVLFDPPHFITNSIGLYETIFSFYKPITWVAEMSDSIKECFRVLKINGFLVFKWGEKYKTLKIVLNMFPKEPLFGVKNIPAFQKIRGTWWIVFRKD